MWDTFFCLLNANLYIKNICLYKIKILTNIFLDVGFDLILFLCDVHRRLIYLEYIKLLSFFINSYNYLLKNVILIFLISKSKYPKQDKTFFKIAEFYFILFFILSSRMKLEWVKMIRSMNFDIYFTFGEMQEGYYFLECSVSSGSYLIMPILHPWDYDYWLIHESSNCTLDLTLSLWEKKEKKN